MTTFALARLLSPLSALLPAQRRALALTASFAVCGVALLACAGSASAIVETAGGVTVGLQPRSSSLGQEGAEPGTFANENGNVVLQGSTGDYAIYWDPNDPVEFDHEWVASIDGYFQAMGEARFDSPFGVLAQYRDRANNVAEFRGLYKGSYSDTTKFPTGKCTDPADPSRRCLTDAQLREQLEAFIASRGLPTGMGTIYYLLTPPSVTVCLEEASGHCSDYSLSKTEEQNGERKSVSYKASFCSYHSDINPDSAPEGDAKTVLYAVIPWTGYTSSYDCQDGGWNPEKHREKHEAPKELTKSEEEALTNDNQEQREAAERARKLEGPHIEEPNQSSNSENLTQALTDVVVNQIAEEEMNTVTDPLLDSWQDKNGDEVTDLCRDYFASTAGEGGSHGEVAGSVKANEETEAGTLSNVELGAAHYYINNVFSRAEGGCSGGVGLVAAFTAPNPLNAGEVFTLDGMESEVSLWTTLAFGAAGSPTPTYASFSWNFGDGTPEVKGYAPGAPTCEVPWLSPCAASALHSYEYGGTYEVTLTVTDVDDNKSSVTHDVVVNGPPPPSPPSSGGGGGAGSSTSSSNAGGGGSTATPSTTSGVSAPVADAAVARQNLRRALRKGLAVDYSVNEQVAGHFEVLLSTAVAHRLGIGGAPATDLPAGSPAETVIAKALLVTTKAGHSVVHIAFSRRTAAKLARARTVSLTVRLIVRNAATSNPATTTAVTSFTLSR